jgi:dTDP-4-amino-4,6-dideoxygalactose transaminase
MQECFAYLGGREGDLPASEAAARETLALPVYPELLPEQKEHVVARVVEFLGTSGGA